MDVAFMHAEHRRAEQARYEPCKIDEARCRRNAFGWEIRREERRKHQSPDDEGWGDGHFSENVEAVKAQREDYDCDCKWHAERDVAVYVAVQKAGCRRASNNV